MASAVPPTALVVPIPSALTPETPLPPTEPEPASVLRLIAHREQAEREFLEVKHVAIFYAAMLVPLLAFFGWGYHTGDDTAETEYWAGGVLYGIIAVFAWMERHELQGRFSWPRSLPFRVVIALVLTPLATVTLAFAWMTTAEALGWPVQTELLEREWPLWFSYVWVAMMPALFEEIAFRGILFEKLKRLTGPVQAGWVSAIMFGIVHFDVIGLAVFLVPLALMAAWLTHRTRSLWPAMIIHFLHNAAVVTLQSLE